MTDNTIISPVYRYFTADLLTGQILEEIPFRGVSYQRAIKGAGSFTGSIPVVNETDSLDLYENTMPGNTAVYVVRNGVCVWGGIIWTRTYDIVSRVLNVNASEFTSYFYHRRVWKTWTQGYGATLSVGGDLAEVSFDVGFSTTVKPESSVHIDFADAEDIKYSGFYKVASSPIPTSTGFYLDSPKSVADIVKVSRDDDVVTITTENGHGFNSGDKIYVDLGAESDYTGEFEIKVGGSGDRKTFRYDLVGVDEDTLSVTGVASRPLPDGVYENCTVTTRTDTYDYIRSLIDAVAKDFTGADFPNAYIEPGVRKEVDVISKEINSGAAIIETKQKHALSEGQSVEIDDVGPEFDGEYTVSAVITNKKFSYETGGTVAKTDVQVISAEITKVAASNSLATLTTATAHGFVVGNQVEIDVESDLGDFASDFNGVYEITAVPSTTSFQYKVLSSGSLPELTFTRPTVTDGAEVLDIIKGNVANDTLEFEVTTRESTGTTRKITTSATHDVLINDMITVFDLTSDYNGTYRVTAKTSTTISYTGDSSLTQGSTADAGRVVRKKSEATLYTATPNNIAVGDSVTIANANILKRIAEKSYDAANSIATITTAGKHFLETGDSVDISGLRDVSQIVSKKIEGKNATKTVTLTTAVAHNFEKNDVVEIKDMRDVYTVSKKKIDSNVFMLTTATAHNLAVGNTVQVSGITDSYNITRYKLNNNKATLTVGNHNFRVNDTITVISLKDSALVVAKELQAGVATLTTDIPHNFLANSVITVSGVGDKYNGTFTILSATDTQISYETAVTSEIRTAEDAYNVALASAIKRGVAKPSDDADVVKARKTLTDLLNGTRSDQAPSKVTGSAYITSKTSIFNGEHVISEVTATTITYGRTGNNVVSSAPTVLTKSVTNKSASATDCTLTVNNVDSLSVGDKIVVPSGVGTRFAGTFLISSISDGETNKTVGYKKEGEVVQSAAVSSQNITTKIDVVGSSPFNGEFTVASAPTTTSFTYNIGMSVASTLATTAECTLTFESKYPVAEGDSIIVAGVAARYNGTFTVKTLTTNGSEITITYDNAGTETALNESPTGTITPTRVNISETVVELAVIEGQNQSVVSVESVHNGSRTITNPITRNTFSFSQTVSEEVSYLDTFGTASADSIFNGNNKTVTVMSDTTFEYALTGSKNNVLETATNQLAFVSIDGVFNGTFTVTSIDAPDNQFSFSLPLSRRTAIPMRIIPGYGHAKVTPKAIVSSFGPFPGNADIGIEFSTNKYSGVNIIPGTYRGFELNSVGDILNTYADSIDGFEYRIDCEYDAVNNTFKKIFVLIPINFPAAPPAGEVSPLSRFGADKLVFEYPGNISNVTLNETAENSATRFFAVGDTDLGPEAGPPFSVKASEGFLNGTHGKRKWPLLDADVKIDNLQDETSLYPQANRYLTEARPPEGQFTVSVNGSLSPVVGTYSPGDWCSIIVRDKFILERMKNDIELRDTVLVRKIDAMNVTVPDGTTFPETVELTLIPEWEVDKIG